MQKNEVVEANCANIVTSPASEKKFFVDVLQILSDGRYKSQTAVNAAMVITYWNIGRRIVEQEQQGENRANYGDKLLVNLSRYLGDKFGKGF
jgi:hypothetical protein